MGIHRVGSQMMSRGILLILGLVASLGGCSTGATAPTAPQPRSADHGTPAFEPPDSQTLEALVDRIQRECLEAYPDGMLRSMAAGAEEVPDTVEADPTAQMQFLSKELEVDKGLFYPSLLEELVPALEAYLEPGDRLLDLGSGDGRVLFLANVLGAHATGIEYDPEVVQVSRTATEALAPVLDTTRLSVIEGDFFRHSWSGYDAVFYFDLSSFEQERVRDKLRREVDPEGLLIIGHEQAPFPGFELVEQIGPMRVYRPES